VIDGTRVPGTQQGDGCAEGISLIFDFGHPGYKLSLKKTEAATSPMAQVNGRPIQCTTKPLALQVFWRKSSKNPADLSCFGAGRAYIYLLWLNMYSATKT